MVFAESLTERPQKKMLLWFALAVAFGFHALMYGAVLAMQGADSGLLLLTVVILLHRLPVGMVVAFLWGSLLGALGIVSLVSVATILGYWQLETLPFAGIYYIQALAAGALLHVFFGHSSPNGARQLVSKSYCHAGVALATALLLFMGAFMGEEHAHDYGLGLKLWTLFSFSLLAYITFRAPGRGCLCEEKIAS
jgi:hypothetical protein